ncbi:MAG: XrtA system polysaccharide chain length determinant [Pseudomonadales bacterium]|jgi:polysaccharide chain length determinant protein (PEP-CTERM system associated)|nr:XrtA system polysaccharide chain length determinant [Pseudomonadales bacterium]
MASELSVLLRYVRKGWLHRHVALLVAALVCALGWGTVLLLPDVYAASTRVYVDRNSMMGQLLRGLAADTSNVEAEFLRVARTTLTSRPNLERVARETDLTIEAETPADFDRLLQGLEDRIQLQSARGREDLVSIRFEDANPERALAVVRSLLDIFMETVIGSQQRDSLGTQDFLDQQIREYRQRMDEAEAALKTFRRENIATLPRQGSGYFREYQEASEALDEAQLRLRAAQRQRQALRDRIDTLRGQGVTLSDGGVDGGGEMDAPASDATRARALRDRLAELRMLYTDQHPDVQALLRQLAELQGVEVTEVESGDVDAGNARVLEELLVELSRVEAAVASAEVEAEAHQQRMDRMMSALATMPEIEAELQRLTREFELNRSQYDAFIARRESAQISRQADLSLDRDVFRIIDPPRVPALPSGPPRALLLTVVLIAGLVTGGGIAFLLTLLRNTFGDVTELADRTGRVVLGRVGLVRLPVEIRRRRLSYAFSVLGFVVLLSVYGVLLVGPVLGVVDLPSPMALLGGAA